MASATFTHKCLNAMADDFIKRMFARKIDTSQFHHHDRFGWWHEGCRVEIKVHDGGDPMALVLSVMGWGTVPGNHDLKKQDDFHAAKTTHSCIFIDGEIPADCGD